MLMEKYVIVKTKIPQECMQILYKVSLFANCCWYSLNSDNQFQKSKLWGKSPVHRVKLECIDLNPSSSKQEDNFSHILLYKEAHQGGTNGQIYSVYSRDLRSLACCNQQEQQCLGYQVVLEKKGTEKDSKNRQSSSIYPTPFFHCLNFRFLIPIASLILVLLPWDTY